MIDPFCDRVCLLPDFLPKFHFAVFFFAPAVAGGSFEAAVYVDARAVGPDMVQIAAALWTHFPGNGAQADVFAVCL